MTAKNSKSSWGKKQSLKRVAMNSEIPDAELAGVVGGLGHQAPHHPTTHAPEVTAGNHVMTPAAQGAIDAALLQHEAAQAAPTIHEMTPAAQGAIAAAIKLNDSVHAAATTPTPSDAVAPASPQKGILINSTYDVHGNAVTDEAAKSAANSVAGAQLDAALLQSYYQAPTDGTAAHAEKDGTHVLASAGAGVSNTIELGHGVNLVSQANASATGEAHVGALGVAANAVANAHASETLNLTQHADITVMAGAEGDVHAKASLVTGVGASTVGNVGAEVSINQHEKGSLGSGIDGHQTTTVAVDAGANATATANIGLTGLSGGASLFAGASAHVGETAGIAGHGVAASASVAVYSPGVVGASESATFDVHDGNLNIGFSVGVAALIGGGTIGGNISINTKPLVDAAETVGHALESFFSDMFGSHTIVKYYTTPEQDKLQANYNAVLEKAELKEQQIAHGIENAPSFSEFRNEHLGEIMKKLHIEHEGLKLTRNEQSRIDQELNAEFSQQPAPKVSVAQQIEANKEAWARVNQDFHLDALKKKFDQEYAAAAPPPELRAYL